MKRALALLMLGSPMELGMAQELQPDVQGVWKIFQMTNFTMPNNMSHMKYALKSVPGIADVGVLHRNRVGIRTPPKCLEGSGKSFKLLTLLCLPKCLP